MIIKAEKTFTDIGQYRQVVREVRSHHDFAGKDANGDAIYSHTSPYPTLKFRGTVKLHGCLDENTLITLSNGEQVNIKEIKKDTYVLCFDVGNNVQTISKVINVLNGSNDKKWCKLTFDDRIIICTKDHKFWTKNRGYVEAYTLLESDIFENI
jgi:hypothetical protein